MARVQDPEIFRETLENLPLALCLVDPEGRILFWNRCAENMTGFMRHDVIGRSANDRILMHCDETGKLLTRDESPLSRATREGKQHSSELYVRHKAGHRLRVRTTAIPILDDFGVVKAAVECFYELPATPANDRHRMVLAAHGCLDRTSGLLNQAMSQSHLRESLAMLNDFGLRFGVLWVQVQGLVKVAMKDGREAADALIYVIAQTLAHELGPSVTLGRWSEDQFLAIVPDCTAVELEQLAQKVKRVVGVSGIDWWGDPLSLVVTVGRAMAEIGEDPQSLLRRACHAVAMNGEEDADSKREGGTAP
ncbi:MAG TPA: PAS domain S-box protein [Terriglobales bacterium]|nr:PAS domain S-box protein [Terriglobales bacterium]